MSAPHPLQFRAVARLSVVTAVLTALLASVLTPLSASAAPVALSGVVVGPTGTAMPSLTVRALSLPSGAVIATTTTSSSGAFTFSALAPGDYTLGFPATSTTFAQTLGGAATLAESEQLTLDDAGGNAAYVRAALAASGSITGTVKNSSGTALRSIAVKAYTETDGAWVLAAQSTTSTSGTYTIRGLAPGAYRLEVTGGATSSYSTTYSGNAASILNASDVGVVAQVTTRASFTLGKAGTVSGTVRGSFGVSSIELLAGTRVVPYRYVGAVGDYDGAEELRQLSSVTSSAGTFTLKGLPPGEYTLRFEPRTSAPFSPSGTVYGSAFLGGTDQPDLSRSFVVPSGGSVTNRIAVLTAAASLSGTVFDSTSPTTPVPFVRVTLGGPDISNPFDEIRRPLSTVTNALGQYSFSGLAPGRYLVYVGSHFDQNPGDGITESTTWERRQAGDRTLIAGEQATNVDLEATPAVALMPSGAGSTPEISNQTGDWVVGVELEVSPGAWPEGGLDRRTAFSWYRDGVRITGANEARYTVQPGDEGYSLTAVVERFDDVLGYGRYETSPTNTIGLGPAPELNADLPSIDGNPAVGSTLTANVQEWYVITLGESTLGDPGIVWSYVWQRSTDTVTWTTIPGATSATHRVTSTDVTSGPYLRALLSATRDGYNPVVDYPTTTVAVGDGTFTQLIAPRVTTTTTRFSVSTGTWSPAPTGYTYLWRVHDQTGAVIATYSTRSISRTGLTGRYVSVTVIPTAPNVTGLGTTLTVQRGKALVSSGSLAPTGSAVVGGTVTAPALTFTPTATTTTYKWQYLSGTTWRTITGATASSYEVPASMLARKLRVVITAGRTGYPSVTKTSSSTAAVAAGAVLESTGLTTSGVPAAAATMQIDSTTWSPAATSVTYQWRSGPTSAGPWANIAGATASSYTVPASLDGQFLSVLITGKRAGHPDGTTEPMLGQVTGGTLVNLTAPTVAEVGGSPNTFTVTSNGTWTPAATSHQYAWFTYDDEGAQSLIGTGATYDTTNTALYRPVDVRVAGLRSGFSSGFILVPVKDGQLRLNNEPSIGGASTSPLGTTLTSSDFTLFNPPAQFTKTYQWQVKQPGGVWTDIPGAVDLTYRPTAGSFVGAEVRIEGQATAVRYTPLVTTSEPVLIEPGPTLEPGTGDDAPSLSGPSFANRSITVDPGTWSVTGATFTYQWQESVDAAPFANIVGATSPTYAIPLSKRGALLQVIITASKPGHPNGTATVTVPAPVQDPLITSVTAPTVTKSGSVLTVSRGSWSVTGTTPQYLWERVDRTDGSAVTVSTTASYTLTDADIDQYIRVTVGASKPTYTTGTKVVVAQTGRALAPTSQATLTGDRVVGQVRSVSVPTWNADSVETRIQWLRNGVAITGATQSTYTQTALDIGKTISVRVTASQVGYAPGTVTLSSGPTYSTTVLTNVRPPSISPAPSDPRVGDLLTASAGTWSLTGLTYTYQWYRATQPIPGATSSTYRLAAADMNEQVSVRVTAQRTGIAPVTASSRSVSVVEGLAAVLTAPTNFATSGITRNATTGLISSASLTWNRPVTVVYRWESRPDDVSFWQPITGADARSYTPTAAPGTRIRLTVVAERPGYARSTVSSNVIVLP